MRAKRRRRILRTVILILIPALLIGIALGVGAWWLLRPHAMDKNQPSAMPPQGEMRGLRISQEYPTTAGLLSASSRMLLRGLVKYIGYQLI